ncbi:MAG TPA: hypothetical protein PKZ12_06985, partial [Smithellaceae bacterium]|nr:hypothetical protein [Smithellaceae bacterium]
MQLINKIMIDSALKIAGQINADALLICVDLAEDMTLLPEELKTAIGVIIVSREGEELPEGIRNFVRKLDVPNVNLTRVGKIKLAIAKGVVMNLFRKEDKIVCLSGVPKF